MLFIAKPGKAAHSGAKNSRPRLIVLPSEKFGDASGYKPCDCQNLNTGKAVPQKYRHKVVHLLSYQIGDPGLSLPGLLT